MMVSYRDVYFNCEALEGIASELKAIINKIGSNYDEVKNRVKESSIADDMWQGKDKDTYYSTLDLITSKYDGNLEKLNEIYDFLREIIDSYREYEIKTGKKIDNNLENLDM